MKDYVKKCLEFILTKVPVSFGGKENWLGFKLSPHQNMVFVNEVIDKGVKTNEGFYEWDKCSDELIATIFQRLKIIELNGKTK